MSKVYGSAPVEVAEIKCHVEEMFFYQYLPIKLRGWVADFEIENRLVIFDDIIVKCCNDFFHNLVGGDVAVYNEHYIYLTAKRLFVTEGCGLNRDGWHTDGFGSDDINYIWCDSLPTKYICGEFRNVPQDHMESLKYFEHLGNGNTHHYCNVNTIYRLDDTVIHAQDNYKGSPTLRTFVKVSFSKEKYNLKGNSHNYLLDYDWEMKDRGLERNHPVK